MHPRELPGIRITYRQAGRRIDNQFVFAPTHACTLCKVGVQVWNADKFWKKHADCNPIQEWIGSEMSVVRDNVEITRKVMR
jgi:hypothetical protein